MWHLLLQNWGISAAFNFIKSGICADYIYAELEHRVRIFKINAERLTMTPPIAIRKRYSLEYKAKIVLYYRSIQNRDNIQDKSVNHLHRQTQIDYRTLGLWVKAGDKILQSFRKRNSRNLVDTSKYKCICEPMEMDLKQWILKQREEGKCVSGTTIQCEAVKLYNLLHGVEPNERCADARKNFTASRAWLFNFCRRRGFVLRRVSSTGRELQSDVVDVCYSFFSRSMITI